jgi:hypothetical protein
MARQAAIERELARYIHIECGHYTELETQQRYAVLRPKGHPVYCEKCDKWLKPMPPSPRQQLPETPLF